MGDWEGEAGRAREVIEGGRYLKCWSAERNSVLDVGERGSVCGVEGPALPQ